MRFWKISLKIVISRMLTILSSFLRVLLIFFFFHLFLIFNSSCTDCWRCANIVNKLHGLQNIFLTCIRIKVCFCLLRKHVLFHICSLLALDTKTNANCYECTRRYYKFTQSRKDVIFFIIHTKRIVYV